MTFDHANLDDRHDIRQFLFNMIVKEYNELPAKHHNSVSNTVAKLWEKFEDLDLIEEPLESENLDYYFARYTHELAIMMRGLLTTTPTWIQISPLQLYNLQRNIKPARRQMIIKP